ncbi:GHKL domain-containing protein [Faecalimicrobium sp. JNUCC 81]
MLETHLFWIIISILSIVIELSVLKFILGEFGELKKSKLVLNLYLLIVATILIIIMIKEINPNFIMFIAIIITYIFYIFNYKVSKLKGLGVSIFYWIIVRIFYASSYALIFILYEKFTLITKLEYEFIYNISLIRLDIVVLSKVLLLSMIPIIKVINLKSEIRKKDYVYIFISIISNVICTLVIFGLVYRDSYGFSNFTLDTIIIVISAIILLSSIFSIDIINRVIKDNRLRLENKVIKENMDRQYAYYLNLKESQLRVKSLYHDMKNHMICIENIHGSSDYIKNMNKQLEQCYLSFNTENMILDTILSDKKSICHKNNIDFIVDIKFSHCDFIDMLDVCSIFSNMLDNAIEACNKINNTYIERKIKLRGTVVNKFFVIKCENTKVNNINFKNNKFITDKKDLFLHGIGISSIKNSVEKYDGNVETDVFENKFIMTIYIPLIKNSPVGYKTNPVGAI